MAAFRWNLCLPLNTHNGSDNEAICSVSLPPRRKLFPEARRLELTQELMQSADVDPTLRPTELTIAQIRALADAYAHLCSREPGLHSYQFREELKLKHLSGRPSSVQVSPPSMLKEKHKGVSSNSLF